MINDYGANERIQAKEAICLLAHVNGRENGAGYLHISFYFYDLLTTFAYVLTFTNTHAPLPRKLVT